MNLVLKLEEIQPEFRRLVGGKGFALAVLRKHQFTVPAALCISAAAYTQYIRSTGLRERIGLELHRKSFEDMRWEELWDASLRIRNMFLKTPVPRDLEHQLTVVIQETFGDRPVVVRSSAPGEDSAATSFAGLHESYVNIRGGSAILEHVRKVWASLWSDAALLYRQELGLDAEKSTMAVLVQEIVQGERSGVAFGRNPNDPSQAVVESVYGLNQGLVDGTVEPDRWILDRSKKTVISHTPAKREKIVAAASSGVRLEPLPAQNAGKPPLEDGEVSRVLDLALESEHLFGSAQDVEWTFHGETLFTLQSRPITTTREDQGYYTRSWYLSLRRSYENLRALRQRIEGELIPAMIVEGRDLAGTDLKVLSDEELRKEILARRRIYNRWEDVYWKEFIPFAHGARLFGQVYNDAVNPSDPYEFTELLGTGELVSMERNRMLEGLASKIREDPELAENLRDGNLPRADPVFLDDLEAFMDRFGEMSCHEASCTRDRGAIIRLVLEMASRSPGERRPSKRDPASLKEEFLRRFEGEARSNAEDLLELARASYRLRDDDNIYLGRIEGQLLAAVREGLRRVGAGHSGTEDVADAVEVAAALGNPSYVPRLHKNREADRGSAQVRARQLTGQPAGPGMATAKARVVHGPADLREFKSGEILICDAVDPNMTFVVPLSAAIVERRGGMLIHGAIIAREYGLPCVTGIPDATSLIHTGDTITVDGYLGIVTISERVGSSTDSVEIFG
jgi:pyruvate,water dikinase